MIKKVLKFKRLSNGWYKGRSLELCGHMVREYFDVEEVFELHVSTTRPSSDDEYYVGAQHEHGNKAWYVMEGPEKGSTPTTSDLDTWLTEHFSGNQVYVWAMG